MKTFIVRIVFLIVLLIVLNFHLSNAQSDNCPQQQVIYTSDLTPLLSGYCQQGYTIPFLISEQTWRRALPTCFQTRALYAETGIYETMARKQGHSDVENTIALYSPSMMGARVWLQAPGTTTWTPVRVVDYAYRQDAYFHLYWLRSGMEFSKSLADAWGVVDMVNDDNTRYMWGVKVAVTDVHPELTCPDPNGFVELRQWFLDMAEAER